MTEEERVRGYDPAVLIEKLEHVSAAEFGRRVAQHIVKQPSSQNWALVGYAFEHLDEWGFGLEWEQMQGLIERIATQETPARIAEIRKDFEDWKARHPDGTNEGGYDYPSLQINNADLELLLGEC